MQNVPAGVRKKQRGVRHWKNKKSQRAPDGAEKEAEKEAESGRAPEERRKPESV